MHSAAAASLTSFRARLAPPRASSSAMARPMPRAAPVTSAVLPLKSYIGHASLERGEGLLERGLVLHVEDLHRLVDALGQPGQHLARSHLDEPGDPEPDQLLHALDPPHGRGHLLEEEGHDPLDLAV